LIVFAGVAFMAETAKILSPEKTVLLPARFRLPDGRHGRRQGAARTKAKHPEPSSYLRHSTAEFKAESDVCVTSANAVQIVSELPRT
jgi:quinolinate synthase